MPASWAKETLVLFGANGGREGAVVGGPDAGAVGRSGWTTGVGGTLETEEGGRDLGLGGG